MRLGLAGRDDLIAHLRRKWNVDQVIAMNVADLTPADAIFRAAEAMRMRFNIGPTQHSCSNFVRCPAY